MNAEMAELGIRTSTSEAQVRDKMLINSETDSGTPKGINQPLGALPPHRRQTVSSRAPILIRPEGKVRRDREIEGTEGDVETLNSRTYITLLEDEF
jgi:hypothetical protein